VFRGLLASFDQRLANIERHLGIAAEEGAVVGLHGLLRGVGRRLTNIERHLGITADPAAAPETPEADAE